MLSFGNSILLLGSTLLLPLLDICSLLDLPRSKTRAFDVSLDCSCSHEGNDALDELCLFVYWLRGTLEERGWLTVGRGSGLRSKAIILNQQQRHELICSDLHHEPSLWIPSPNHTTTYLNSSRE